MSAHPAPQQPACKPTSPAWRALVRAGFAGAMALTAWGQAQWPSQAVCKAWLGVCWLFLMLSVFTRAKTLRDAHEADLAWGRTGRLGPLSWATPMAPAA